MPKNNTTQYEDMNVDDLVALAQTAIRASTSVRYLCEACITDESFSIGFSKIGRCSNCGRTAQMFPILN